MMKQQTVLEKTFHRKSQGELQPLLDNEQPKVDYALDEKIDKYSIVYWVRGIGGGKSEEILIDTLDLYPLWNHVLITVERYFFLPLKKFMHCINFAYIVFITASGYFTERFAGTVYEKTFQNYFSTYFTCSNLMAYILIMCLQNVRTRV
jgi:hypothetical protein